VPLHPGAKGSRRLLRDPAHAGWMRAQRAAVPPLTSIRTGLTRSRGHGRTRQQEPLLLLTGTSVRTRRGSGSAEHLRGLGEPLAGTVDVRPARRQRHRVRLQLGHDQQRLPRIGLAERLRDALASRSGFTPNGATRAASRLVVGSQTRFRA
jgi:hypothetical protein